MSSWHTGQIKYALGIGSLMSFYGIVTFIVMMMPEGSIGRNQKVVVIVLLLLTLPFTLLGGYLASRRSKKKAAKEAAANEQAAESAPAAESAKKLSTPQGSYDGLAGSAEEAVQFLKSSNLGEGGIYSLPWYLVVGAPRSGKTSLVVGSNLNFQALPSQRESEMKFVRPTANVDWRVASEAVFLDTSGRYQTEGGNADEWSAVLETIKKYRSSRPIDGLILTVNAESVMRSDERQNEELAKVLRSRLDEAMQRLKVRFPVYIVFTHADSIEGFRDSFSTSKQEDKNLVWGATIPLEKSENAQTLFDGEYELLHNSVMKRRLVRLSAPFPPVRQLRIFNFPLHFGSGRRKFGAFVNALFRPNPFSENPFLRGFYFTASPAAKGTPSAISSVGTTHFTDRLLRDVVLRDKDLVKTLVAQRRRPPLLGWFLTIMGTLLVLTLLGFAGVSLFTNKQMLAEATVVGEKGLELRRADANKDILAKKEDDVRQEMRVLEDMRLLLETFDEYNRDGAPIYMRFGMYSGDAIYTRNLLPLYFNIVEGRFKQPTVRRLEDELRKFADGKESFSAGQLTPEQEQKLDRHYNLLKAYLMLSDGQEQIGSNVVRYRDKAEGGHLVNTLRDFWTTDSKIPAEMKETASKHLEFWARQVDRADGDGKFPRIELNDALVKNTREKLRAFPAANRYYSNQITMISKEIDDKIGPTTIEGLISRGNADSSLITGTYRVPGAFTRPGLEMMKTAISEADSKLSEDDWVMGEVGKRDLQMAQATDAAKLEEFYYRDYADNWRKLVRGAQVRPFKDRADAADAMQKFSFAQSPMKILVIEIERNTNLSKKVEGGGLLDWLMSFFTKKSADEPGNSQPEKEFRPLVGFVGTPDQGENANIEKYQAQIGRINSTFARFTDGDMQRLIEAYGKEEDPLDLVKREEGINSLVSGFGETSAGQEVASLLQQPIASLRTLLGAGIKQQLVKAWNDEIVPEAKKFEGAYPFTEGATEADMTVVSGYLNPTSGKFSKFFDARLSKYFEEVNGQFTPREGSEVQFSDEFVKYLNDAFALRRALFGTSEAPKVEYEFALRPVKDAIVEVTIDGQKITSEGTGSVRLTFPGQSSETGVVVNIVTTGGSATPTDSPQSGGLTQTTATSNPFQGYWGLFRFVDSSNPQKQSGGEYLLTFSAGGKSATATIRSSGGDIFDKEMFRKVKTPSSFIK